MNCFLVDARRTSLLGPVAALVLHAAVAGAQPLPAFSGAEGPGATATGGRGGDVYHVTNLAFDLSGTVKGSLQYGLKNVPSAGRTIVFDVGGTIYQPGGGAAAWFRADAGNVTIAGQTAPGGITIAGVGTKWTGDNVILRNVTARPNKDPVNPTSYTYDGFSLQVKNSIVDHVSTSAVMQVRAILQHQVVQNSPDQVCFRLVVARPLTPAEEQHVIAVATEALGGSLRVSIDYVAEITRGPNGKFAEFERLFPVPGD